MIRKTEGDNHKIQELHETVQCYASRTTVQRLFRDLHKRKWRQRERPELLSIHAGKRLDWAREYAHFTATDWGRIIWSDECSVERGKGVRPTRSWYTPTEQLRERDIHAIGTGNGVKQMFWAGFTHNRRSGLVPLDGDPDSQQGGVTGLIMPKDYKSYLPGLVQF